MNSGDIINSLKNINYEKYKAEHNVLNALSDISDKQKMICESNNFAKTKFYWSCL